MIRKFLNRFKKPEPPAYTEDDTYDRLRRWSYQAVRKAIENQNPALLGWSDKTAELMYLHAYATPGGFDKKNPELSARRAISIWFEDYNSSVITDPIDKALVPSGWTRQEYIEHTVIRHFRVCFLRSSMRRKRLWLWNITHIILVQFCVHIGLWSFRSGCLLSVAPLLLMSIGIFWMFFDEYLLEKFPDPDEDIGHSF